MTDKEKLVELFNQKERLLFGRGFGISETMYESVASYLIDNGVVVREKGEWVLGHVEPGYCTPGGNRPWVCSKCGCVISWRLDKPTENFCNNCGADMRKG